MSGSATGIDQSIMRMGVHMFFALALAATVSVANASHHDSPAAALPTGEQILRDMHDHYAGKWYRTMTFVQKTTVYDSTGKQTVSTWYESITLPGTIRIDFGSPADGNGVLATRDSTFIVQKGAVTARRPGGNILLTLAFDVYAGPVDQTIGDVRGAGYDLSKVHRDTWQGKPVYVVGADSGNLNVPQFWIDPKEQVLLRIFTPVRAGSTEMRDIRFEQWRPIGGGMIAPHVDMFGRGTRQRTEDYSEIKTNVQFSPDLFDVTKWMTAPNWAKSQ
jgi:outer membrane lipoprotein-sorting protein